MACTWPKMRVTACALLVATAGAQGQTQTSVASTGDPTSTAQTSAITATSSEDAAMALWGIANSLLTSYYPSTSITNLASLSWPDSVVIGSSTYIIHSGSTLSTISLESTRTLATSTANKQPASTDSAGTPDDSTTGENSGSSGKSHTDRTLGIALGVVFGVIAFALLLFILFWVHRRHKRHGGNDMFRRSPSLSHNEIDSWRSPRPEMGTSATATGPLTPGDGLGPSREWVERYNRLSNQHTPPAHLHPAFANNRHASDETYTSSEDNPFFTPMERSDAQLEHHREPDNFIAEQSEYHPGYPRAEPHDAANTALGAYVAAPRRSSSPRRRSSSSAREERRSRPPTPFSPMMMLQTASPPQNRNPFASPEDDEVERRRLADEDHDIVSPILPSRSPHRRHSPMVHYPSWSEMSEFDFTGEHGGKGRRTRDSSSGSDGGDGYRRERESVIGRSELA